MDQGPEALDMQRALRRQIVSEQLALAQAEYAEALARGNARLLARGEGKVRRAEAALAALDQHTALHVVAQQVDSHTADGY